MLKNLVFRYCAPYLFGVTLQYDFIVNNYGTIKETFYELCLSARTDGTRHFLLGLSIHLTDISHIFLHFRRFLSLNSYCCQEQCNGK